MTYYDPLWQLVTITGVIVLLGAIVCFYAFKIFARTRQRSMAYLGAGFAFISAGSALSWWGFWFAGWDAVQCQLGTVAVSTIGFAAILYSLRTTA